MVTYWESDEGVERREYQQSDEWLEKCRASGFLAGATPTQTVVPPPTAATLATFELPAATAPLVPGLAPPSVAAPPMPLPNPWERDEARARNAGLPPRAPPAAPSAATILRRDRRAAVVPPEPGAPRRFVGVSWITEKGLWRASYKYAKRTRDSENRRTLGHYATEERAARARHKHICDEGLEQFNTMDVLDAATDLMVPREKKPPKKRPVAAAPTRQSSRARKVSRAAEASAEQENMRF